MLRKKTSKGPQLKKSRGHESTRITFMEPLFKALIHRERYRHSLSRRLGVFALLIATH